MCYIRFYQLTNSPTHHFIMPYYDPKQIRAIPLIEVAKRLGLQVDAEGYTPCLVHWGAQDPGRNTCSLNEPDNYFRCSCGNSGWNTDLVRQAKQCDVVEAIQWLGTEFNLTPVRRPKKTDYVTRSRGLTDK
jgi:hypothetical protein